jgi:hypothetical protein
MRTKAIIAALAGSLLWVASAAFAQDGAGAGTTTGGGNVCLWTYMIDHTHVVDRNTVLFYTKDGHVWRNDLKSPCPGLEFHGFSFVSRSDQICSNAVGIRVIRTGEVCALGPFSPYAGPQHASAR